MARERRSICHVSNRQVFVMIIGIEGEESRRRIYVMLVVNHKSQGLNPLRRKVPANRGYVKFSTGTSFQLHPILEPRLRMIPGK